MGGGRLKRNTRPGLPVRDFTHRKPVPRAFLGICDRPITFLGANLHQWRRAILLDPRTPALASTMPVRGFDVCRRTYPFINGLAVAQPARLASFLDGLGPAQRPMDDLRNRAIGARITRTG